jgi:para-nitrobenzyl esterase
MHLKTGKPVYRYHYERPRPGNNAGAVHSAEIEYAMGNLARNTVFAWTPDDYAVSAVMQAYFAQFIKTGNPNGKGLPKWNQLNAEKPAVMRIDVNSRQEISAVEERYKTLDKLAQKK